MTRVLLLVALGGLTLALGLWTCLVVSHNHQRAQNLTHLQRRLEMRRAANTQLGALADAHVWGHADAPGASAAAGTGAAREARP